MGLGHELMAGAAVATGTRLLSIYGTPGQFQLLAEGAIVATASVVVLRGGAVVEGAASAGTCVDTKKGRPGQPQLLEAFMAVTSGVKKTQHEKMAALVLNNLKRWPLDKERGGLKSRVVAI